MAVLLAGVIPLLLGLLFELVIVAPLRVPLDQTPLFYPWQVICLIAAFEVDHFHPAEHTTTEVPLLFVHCLSLVVLISVKCNSVSLQYVLSPN